MNRITKMNRRLRNLLFVLVLFVGLISLASYGQVSLDKIKDSDCTTNWKEKISMKHDTIEWDWSDEEPMIEEQLLEPLDIERIV